MTTKRIKKLEMLENLSRGSYDLSVISSNNVLFKNCRQTNDINNETYWEFLDLTIAIFVFENCTLSFIGNNATIRNSTPVIWDKINWFW